jgi:hypothetical protein
MFLEGAPIDDVITILEERRCFELPATLCSARARETAATAQRMISRRNFADLVTKRRTKCHY